jgi:hypothetical protein
MAANGPAAGAAGLTAPATRVGRDGRLAVRVEQRDGRSVLTGCRWTMPLQVLAPVALDDPAAVVWMLNPTGGLVGGDRLAIDVEVGPGAHACLTTPSATKVYRTAGATAEQTIKLTLAPRARLEWVPDHTIPFAGAALRQRIEADVGEGASMLLIDAFAAGRVARGERWRFALLDCALSVRDARGWLVHDRLVLRDGVVRGGRWSTGRRRRGRRRRAATTSRSARALSGGRCPGARAHDRGTVGGGPRARARAARARPAQAMSRTRRVAHA